jgi:acetyl-CoA synthetase
MRLGTEALTAQSIALIVQHRAMSAGFKRRELGGHSLKRGALTSGMEAGAHPARLKRLGRHKSYAMLGEHLEFGDLFEGHPLEGATEGNLCIADSWPGQMRTVFGDHERFIQTYFSTFKGYYFTGDGARRDEDGYYWITGRVDDVINVSGHRMGTAEVESALVANLQVAEAAVVGFPHDIKGQGIYAYVTLKAGVEPTETLKKELIAWVRKEIGPIAAPDVIQWAPGLPKTLSGKIMLRILRNFAADETDSLGDISTLADPSVVTDLVDTRHR